MQRRVQDGDDSQVELSSVWYYPRAGWRWGDVEQVVQVRGRGGTGGGRRGMGNGRREERDVYIVYWNSYAVWRGMG